jgi:hypothetical protein
MRETNCLAVANQSTATGPKLSPQYKLCEVQASSGRCQEETANGERPNLRRKGSTPAESAKDLRTTCDGLADSETSGCRDRSGRVSCKAASIPVTQAGQPRTTGFSVLPTLTRRRRQYHGGTGSGSDHIHRSSVRGCCSASSYSTRSTALCSPAYRDTTSSGSAVEWRLPQFSVAPGCRPALNPGAPVVCAGTPQPKARFPASASLVMAPRV